MFTQSRLQGEEDPLSSTKLANVKVVVPDILKRQISSNWLFICPNWNLWSDKCKLYAPEMYLSRHQSNGKKSILHKSILLSQELHHGHCKVVSYSSQSNTFLPSSTRTLRQRYQAFTGTTCSENSQGEEQKNMPVFQHVVIRPIQNGINNMGDKWALYRHMRATMWNPPADLRNQAPNSLDHQSTLLKIPPSR